MLRLLGIRPKENVFFDNSKVSLLGDKNEKHNTHIYKILVISNEQVPQDTRFVQVPERDHVLDSVYGGGVHGFDTAFRRQPLLLSVVVPDPDPPALGGEDACADRHIELPARHRLDPYVVALK